MSDAERVTPADANRRLDGGLARTTCCYLSDLVARMLEAKATMRSWIASREEDRLEVGCGIFASRPKADAGAIPDAEAERCFGRSRRRMRGRPTGGATR